MRATRSPSDIAREALKRLSSAHLPPTPANFQAAYNEIAELPNVPAFAAQPLQQLADSLTPHNPTQVQALADLDAAIRGRTWQGVQHALAGFCNAAGAESGRAVPPTLAGTLAHLIEGVRPVFGHDDGAFNTVVEQLVAALQTESLTAEVLDGLLPRLTRLAAVAAEEQVEIRESLLRLLHLIIENIGELAIDDHWLKGQIDGLLAAVSPPLTLRHLDDMERRLRDVMDKQSRARARSIEAQEEMRQMLASFVEQLAEMTESSSSFQGQIEESARRIERATRVEELTPLLKDVVAATHAMADETARSRAQLGALQEKVQATEAELAQLHLELDNASALARHDPLTDALNRKGLDEALAREIAATQRHETPLSVCMLDIDNFKKLNDRLGHEAGDHALVHLANMARACMRPSDTLARYGGEEFVILMPDTPLDQGVEAMVRLQRELTKAFFMAGKEKVLITFSAGVAQLQAGESGAEAIRRADQAMYLAKRAGKNRVLGA